MESSSSRRQWGIQTNTHTHSTNREKSVSNKMAAAVMGKSCPICFTQIQERRAAVIAGCMHAYCLHCIYRWSNLKRNCPLCNAHFHSWFFNINLSTRTFHTHKLPPRLHHPNKNVNNRLRIVTRSNGPVPSRRSFGRLASVPPYVIKERVLHWRSSIYEQYLQAVPCSSRSSVKQENVAGKSGVKERILERIEPWIRRELQAILEDPDPSIIVHVATSLFISSFEEKHKVSSVQSGGDDNLEPLRPFLLERTDMFWHELGCFAESSFNMETYDAVVEYKKWSD